MVITLGQRLSTTLTQNFQKKNFEIIIDETGKLGLKINSDKCELFFVSGFKDPKIVSAFEQVAPAICITERHEFEILGAHNFEEGYPNAYGKTFESLTLLASILEAFNAHTAYCVVCTKDLLC